MSDHPTVGLSMIVKNGAETIRPCLESVRGVVDQIVVADTGSTDNCCEIAREFGATVISVPWENHFAHARNAALKPVTTDWVLVIDADEELDHEARKRVPPLLNATGVGGYVTPIRNYVLSRFTRAWDRTALPNDYRHPRAEKAAAFVVHENCRLFRRDAEIYFVGRVHEAVEPRIKGLGLKLRPAPFFIHHFGQLSTSQAREEKSAFYRDLLRLKAEEQPNDPLAWIQLGLEEFEHFGNSEEALKCLDRALILEPRASDGWTFKSMVLLDLGRPQEALTALNQVHRNSNGAALREQLRGDALHFIGKLEESRIAYREALKLGPQDPIVESKLGFVEVRLGHNKAGLTKLQRASAAAPALLEVQDRLVKAYILTGDLLKAAEEAENILSFVAHPKLFLRAASIRAQLQQSDRVAEVLTRGLSVFPESPELKAAQQEVMTLQTSRNVHAAGR